jgi:hypothetical protein
MSEDKSYLDELADYMSENHRKRNEEMDSLSDVSQRKPFTKQILNQNPNIPQDDVRDYVDNVKNDRDEYMMGMAGSSPALKIGSHLEGLASKLPEMSRFRQLLDSPLAQKIRQPFKQERNIDLNNKAVLETQELAKKNLIPEQQIQMPDEVTQQRNYKNWFDDKVNYEKELGYINKQDELQNAIKQNNDKFKLDPNLDQTQPGISQELIDEILKKAK